MEIYQAYYLTTMAIGALAVLLFLQLIAADVLGILKKHTPGAQVEADHSDILFRAIRTVANSNESVAIFILAVGYCVLSGASAEYTGYAALGYVASRFAYAVCYYFDLRILRSTVFGLSLLMLAGLLLIGGFA